LLPAFRNSSAELPQNALNPAEFPRFHATFRKCTHELASLKTVLGLLKEGDPDRETVLTALERYEPVRALSIRQPNAEAILRGVKKIEYRSGPTNIRGRILIYASLSRYSTEDEADMMTEYRIKDVTCDELPRGVLVGSVELYDCDGGDWHLRNPQRAKKLVRPKNQPQPVWFKPF